MNKQKIIQSIKIDFLQSREQINACLLIIDYLCDAPLPALQRLHFDELAKAAQLKNVKDVLPLVQYLTSSRAPILKSQFYFHDGQDVFILTKQEVLSAVNSKHFFHPVLLQRVPDFDEKISLYFTLTQDGIDMISNP